MIAQARERFTKDLWTDRHSAEKPRLVTLANEADQARYVADRVLEDREAGLRLKDQAVLFRSSSHSGPLEVELTRRNVPFVKYGGLKFLDSAHVKDLLALLRFAQNPRDRVAGFRVLLLLPGVGPVAAGRILDALDLAPDPRAALPAVEPPPRAGADWPGLVAALTSAAGWPGEIGAGPGLVRPASRPPARGRRVPPRRPPAAGADRRRLPVARAVPDRTDARPARRHQRPGRRAAEGRGLPDPLDDPLRQGAGVAVGAHPERGRRLHPLGPRHRARATRSRRSGGCSTSP